jgi:hypothetical protein
MKQKDWYEALKIDIILYPEEDIVRTSKPDNVESEVGDGWDNEGWGN